MTHLQRLKNSFLYFASKWNEQPIWFDRLWIALVIAMAFVIGRTYGLAYQEAKGYEVASAAHGLLMQCISQLGSFVHTTIR